MKKEDILEFANSKKLVIASTPGYLLPCVGWMRGFMRSRKYFEHPLEILFLIVRKDGLASQIGEEKQVFEKIKELYDFPKKTRQVADDWRRRRDEFFKKYSELSKQQNLKNFSDKEFGQIILEFFDNQIELWAAPLQADLLGVYAETELFEEFARVLPESEKAESHEIFAAISRPAKISFVSEERLSILELTILFKENKKNFDQELAEHQEKYFWIKNTYRYLQALPISYFLGVVKEESKKDVDELKLEIEKTKSAMSQGERDRRVFFAQHKLDNNFQEKLKLTPFLGEWLDERKEYNLKSNHFVFVLATEVARRTGLKIEEIYCLLPQEILKVLSGEKFDKNALIKRQKSLVYITTLPEREFLFSGNDAEEIILAFDKKFSNHSEIKEIKGVVASKGVSKTYRGKVRIVHDVANDPFEDGEILVTSSTRPEFVSLMRKALCILTDEGGIASHAAIVSRELGKPCVIGTKIATKVLKNGDEVEINVNSGIIKII